MLIGLLLLVFIAGIGWLSVAIADDLLEREAQFASAQGVAWTPNLVVQVVVAAIIFVTLIAVLAFCIRLLDQWREASRKTRRLANSSARSHDPTTLRPLCHRVH